MAGKGGKNRLSTRSKGGKAPKYSLCGTNGPARSERRFRNRKDTPIDKVENKLFRSERVKLGFTNYDEENAIMGKEAGISGSRMQLRSRGLHYNLRSRVRVSEVVEFSRSAKKRKTPTISKSKLKSETERSDEDHSKQKGRIIYASKALCFLRSEKNLDYELVKPGCIARAGISRWIVVHINFDAKLRDCPDDPVQTFFAQLRIRFVCGWTEDDIFVDCCVNLGPKDKLPEFVYSGGCQYCGRNLLRHPFGGCEKLLLGCRNDDSRWLFGESKGRACFGEDPEYY